jgi:hypothetical protein
MTLENIPTNDEVEEVANELKGEWRENRFGKTLVLALNLKQLAKINILARAIRRVIGRGARYPDPNWKWMAPRTAESLKRFVRKMKEAKRSSAAFNRLNSDRMT